MEMSEEDLQFIEAQRKEDALEPSLVHEYSDEIFHYMRDLEVTDDSPKSLKLGSCATMMPDPAYMDNQSEIQWEMRGVLIDWLVQVHGRFQMQNETLFLCVNFIDRFLSAKVVSVQKFQLVGVTALLLAAKFEEISAPSIADLVYMVDNGYDAEEIKKAERYMVQLLNFELGFPGPMSFLRRVSKADDYCQSTRTLAKYLVELTIMDEKFIGITPSMIAAAGDMLARKFLKGSEGEWTPVHVHYSSYTAEQLEDVAALIIERAMDRNSHQSIYDKYADARYWKASVYVQQWFEKYGYQEEYFFPNSSR
ncbi:MAG: cyclin-like protein [Olpidium bornovanus]|uniref:Cyclin-like protein n=1 Tax=Olpidium bornovanus TaxID=278681 RepID=A0A8H7ZUE5_9FUNG|nr:MAG: cyclin-like protein [Olpidium bornovanus]